MMSLNEIFKTEKFYCGDSEKLIKNIPKNCIDLVITSPPYDQLRDYDNFEKLNWKPIIIELYRVIKWGGVVVWVVGDQTRNGGETLTSFEQALFAKSIGFNVETMIYKKINPVPNAKLKRYQPSFEYMFIFIKGKSPKTFNPIMVSKSKKTVLNKSLANSYRGKDGVQKNRYSNNYSKKTKKHNVWEYYVGNLFGRKGKIKYLHPATFPNKLVYDHIISWTNPGEIVFDPFCGIGTVAYESIRTGRKWIGFDISEKYIQLAKKYIQLASPPLPGMEP